MDKFQIVSRNGDTLKGHSWIIKDNIANIIIMEGMEEHCSRYDAFAQYLNKEGFSVYALDTYGQGENVNPDLSNIGIWPEDGFNKQVLAVDSLVEQLKETGKPTYLFSHSMGSFMCQSYISVFSGHVEKVVLCGSGSKNPALGAGYLLAKMINNKKNKNQKAKLLNKLMFGSFNKKIKNPRTDYDWLSVNEANVDKYIADPLCGFGPTNGFCLEFIKGMKPLHTKKFVSRVDKNQQIFIISGSDDPVTNYGKSVGILKAMYAKAGVNNVETKVYQGLRHEILNEDAKEEVFKDVVAFFKR